MIKIALFQPDIPQNTAATIRLCACLNATLEIIEPCGFQFNEKKLKSIYMDYYKNCKIIRHLSFEDFIKTKKNKRIILLTTKAKKSYYNFNFKKSDTILFLIFYQQICIICSINIDDDLSMSIHKLLT